MSYAKTVSAIRGHVHDIGADLEVWDERGAEPNARARRYANEAMDAIDAALAGLHGLRAQLVTDIRTSDDASATRVDALLAERKLHSM